MRPTIEQLRYLTDFGTIYRWDSQFNLPAAVQAAINTDELNMRLTSTSVPKRTTDAIEIANRGHIIFREGIARFSQQITLSTLGTIDAMIHSAVRNWQQIQWNDNQGRQSTVVAKDRQATVRLMALNNIDQQYWSYVIMGAWLQDSDFGEFGSDASDIIRPSLVLQYDYYVDGPAA